MLIPTGLWELFRQSLKKLEAQPTPRWVPSSPPVNYGMSYKDKAYWCAQLWMWDNPRRLAFAASGCLTEALSIYTHGEAIRQWVDGSVLEIKRRDGCWCEMRSMTSRFFPDCEYRIQTKEEFNVEQYSKEFWQRCLNMHPMHLSNAIAGAINEHKDHIEAWVGGVRPEVYGDSGWVLVPKDHHRFTQNGKYRAAPPKPKQCDVVVFYRDAIQCGTRYEGFIAPAGIDVKKLPVEPTSKHVPTLDKLKANTPGFKLLSITRVVVDENHNLLEYSTKLDNLGRVPF